MLLQDCFRGVIIILSISSLSRGRQRHTSFQLSLECVVGFEILTAVNFCSRSPSQIVTQALVLMCICRTGSGLGLWFGVLVSEVDCCRTGLKPFVVKRQAESELYWQYFCCLPFLRHCFGIGTSLSSSRCPKQHVVAQVGWSDFHCCLCLAQTPLAQRLLACCGCNCFHCLI